VKKNPGSSAYKNGLIDYFAVGDDFLEYLDGRHLDSRCAKSLVSYLDKFMVPLALRNTSQSLGGKQAY